MIVKDSDPVHSLNESKRNFLLRGEGRTAQNESTTRLTASAESVGIHLSAFQRCG